MPQLNGRMPRECVFTRSTRSRRNCVLGGSRPLQAVVRLHHHFGELLDVALPMPRLSQTSAHRW
jgi:hypothetical protein